MATEADLFTFCWSSAEGRGGIEGRAYLKRSMLLATCLSASSGGETALHSPPVHRRQSTPYSWTESMT